MDPIWRRITRLEYLIRWLRVKTSGILDLNGKTLTLNDNLTVGSLTSGRVLIASANDTIGDDSGLTYTPASDLLALGSDAGSDPDFRLLDGDVSQPFSAFPATMLGSLTAWSGSTGGLNVRGVSDTDATGIGLNARVGAASTTAPAIIHRAGKHDGAGGTANLADTEIHTQWQKSDATVIGTMYGSGRVVFPTVTNDIALPYAHLSDSTTQSSGGTSSANLVTYDTDAYKVGITHSTVTNPSRVTIDNAGAYAIEFSAVVNASGVNKHIDIWLKVDGSNVANSNTHYELPLSGETLVTVELFYVFTANQYFEIAWASTDDAGMTLLATAAAASPTRPASPSVIVTVNKVSS